ncbi:hypothetical protein GCM10020221_20210 [Streptomyces thioluteus]|uniref:Transposase n=1 Tax=Streptomyces thioluteus TaxID=66431 RepID=A0ABN3WPV7_STRTU
MAAWGRRPAGQPVPPQLAHLDYRWPVRLGNAGQKGDGLIGYFRGDGLLDVLRGDDTGRGRRAHGLRRRDRPRHLPSLPADSTTQTHLTLLLDPLAAVHATTDVLPVTDLQLPSRFTRTALAAMRVAFRLSPVLTTARKLPTGSALAVPHPKSPQGTWDWAELTPASEWSHQPIVQIDQNAGWTRTAPSSAPASSA